MNLYASQRAGGIDQARHLLNSFDNDQVEVLGIRGSAAHDVVGFMTETEAIASGTNCRKPFYALSISPPFAFSADQYAATIERIESELGLAGQPRVVIRHVKNGREHYHTVWSRIDHRSMTAIHLSHDRLKLQKVRREMAARFGYQLPNEPHNRPPDSPAESAHANATGITPDQRRHDITEAYMASDNAASFRAALAELGYTLARGDKRAFVVVDESGSVHSLTRHIKSVRTKHILALLAPLKPEDLPSVHDLEKSSATFDHAALEQAKAQLQRKLQQNHAKRKASLYRDHAALETRHAEELRALQYLQHRELASPFARFSSAVTRLIRSYPVLRLIIRPFRHTFRHSLAERHIAELENLRRRHSHEWHEYLRRERLVRLLNQREAQSLTHAIWRAVRRSEREKQSFAINVRDVTSPSLFFDDVSDEGLDSEIAALEREYQGTTLSLTSIFNAAANPAYRDDDGDDTGPAPTLATGLDKNA